MQQAGDVYAVDEHHLVALVELWVAPVRRRVGRHTRHQDRHVQVGAALHVETEPASTHGARHALLPEITNIYIYLFTRVVL